MNKRFLTLVGVATVLSAGTYFGLTILKPHVREETKVADVTSPDQVFSASVSAPEAASGTEPAAATAAPAEAAATVAPADTAVQPAADAASAAPAAPAAEPAAAAPPAETKTAAAEPAAAPEPAAPEPAAAEPAPAAAEPAAAAPAEATMPAEKPKKSAHKKSAPTTTTHKGGSNPAAASKVWWPAENANKLSLVYAGQASFKKAIVLLFNGAFFKTDSVNSNLKVTDKNGKTVSGHWDLGENNRRMLVFPVAAAGTYKVSVGSGLIDNKGRKLGARLSGPVQIR
jgi:hypothetical protein